MDETSPEETFDQPAENWSQKKKFVGNHFRHDWFVCHTCLAVINQPGWAFALTGLLILLLVIVYIKEILQSIRNRKR